MNRLTNIIKNFKIFLIMSLNTRKNNYLFPVFDNTKIKLKFELIKYIIYHKIYFFVYFFNH